MLPSSITAVMKQSSPAPEPDLLPLRPVATNVSVLGLVVALWCAMRPLAGRVSWVFLGFISTVCIGIKFWAESNLLTVFLAYLPIWVMVLAYLGCALLAVFFACWRQALVACCLGGASVVWLGGHITHVGGRSPSRDSSSLKVITYNRGQGTSDLLAQFEAGIVSDIGVLQDAGRRLPQIAAMPAFVGHTHHFQSGEFVLLSRWPVLEGALLELEWPETPGKPYAAGCRCVIDWNGRRIVVYNVHFPTPRDLLYWYGRHGTFLYGVLGLVPGTSLARRHGDYLRPWRSRVHLVEQIVSRVRAEKDPVILLGDLNLPPVGEAYHALCGELQDVHSLVGRGFGHTFPGNMKSFPRLLAPWIRIDYIFVSDEWGVSSCHVAPLQNSQHLPLAATIYLR